MDIACIRETHNDRTDSEEHGEYITFYGESDRAIKHPHRKNKTEIDTNRDNKISYDDDNATTAIGNATYKAGVSIEMRNSSSICITGITRVNNRIVEIRLQSGTNAPDISLLDSYAPPSSYGHELTTD